MLTSKQRAELRARANQLPVLLTVGKGGVSGSLIAEADTVLTAKELVKGQVLESALLTAREACDAICEATGADGVQTVGSKFVIYRFSQKCEDERKAMAVRPKRVNPVRAGAQARRRKAKEEREARNAYFKQAAIQAAIDKKKDR
ncbi:MAG: YhbY family RNA-binding protein [Oscillospiraceae bacterium]|nr:YhbY family RNA-binding protein [Oscillospiraceae bacterium]